MTVYIGHVNSGFHGTSGFVRQQSCRGGAACLVSSRRLVWPRHLSRLWTFARCGSKATRPLRACGCAGLQTSGTNSRLFMEPEVAHGITPQGPGRHRLRQPRSRTQTATLRRTPPTSRERQAGDPAVRYKSFFLSGFARVEGLKVISPRLLTISTC